MSFSGWLNDRLLGQPSGTTDAQTAQAAATDQALLAQNQRKVDQGVWTQAQADQAATNIGINNQLSSASADTNAQAAADAGTTGYQPPPSAAQQLVSNVEAGASTIPDSLAHPVDTFTAGLAWEGQAVGNVAGQVGGAAVGAASSAFSGTFKGIAKRIPWWLWLLLLGGAVFYFWPMIRPFAKKLAK